MLANVIDLTRKPCIPVVFSDHGGSFYAPLILILSIEALEKSVWSLLIIQSFSWCCYFMPFYKKYTTIVLSLFSKILMRQSTNIGWATAEPYTLSVHNRTMSHRFVQNCAKAHRFVQNCTMLYRFVQNFQKLQKSVQNHLTLHRSVQNCTKWHRSVPTIH